MSLFGPSLIRTIAVILLLLLKVRTTTHTKQHRHNHGLLQPSSTTTNNNEQQSICPSKKYSWCLQIDGYDSVILDGNKYFNLKRFFQNILSADINDTERHFHHFRLINNPKISHLEEHTFGDITFKRIEIKNCTHLTRIDKNAFSGHVSRSVEVVYIDLIAISEPNVQQFFDALNSLENLKELYLFQHNIIKLIPFSFRQKNLIHLEVGGPLETISNAAFFHATSLKIIRLYDWVNHIPKHSFDFGNRSNDTLDIYFNMNFNSIEVGTFDKAHRPLTVNLYLKKLKYFDQLVFEPFLMSELRNDLMFIGELKEIQDKCKLYWLWRSKDKFKGRFGFKSEKIGETQFAECTESDEKLVNSVESIGHSSRSSNKYYYTEFTLFSLLALFHCVLGVIFVK